MTARLDDFNRRFVYTTTNPENIIGAPKGALFFRRGLEFYLNREGNLDATWTKLPYRTVILPHPPLTKEIKYEHPYEVWLKTIDGNYDEYGNLLPKQGWTFVSNDNLFSRQSLGKALNWILPPPTSSDDSIGNNNSRSYDENFFYAKIGGKWYRTPISIYNTPGDASADDPYWTNNLPFVDAPRFAPVPPATGAGGFVGEQSYDSDFFYIFPTSWKRSALLRYVGVNKMACF